MNINWDRIATAIDFYKSVGFEYVELDWMQPKPIIDITAASKGNPNISTNYFNLELLGSAEQSFIAMDLARDLPIGKYVACTPCYRWERDGFDELHQLHFMKVELYVNDIYDKREVVIDDVMKHAYRFMCRTIPGLEYRKTTEGWDIESRGIELGSYGYRRHGPIEWVYGTGLAEPRMSIAKNEYNRYSR